MHCVRVVAVLIARLRLQTPATGLLRHQLRPSLLQALRWDPGNSQLEADLEEVQQCMRPMDAATLRQAGQRRFKMKACSLPARPAWGLTGTQTQQLPDRRAASVSAQL